MDFNIEKQCYEQYGPMICGVDEAGRGPLCGPVYAAAVILSEDTILYGLNDSKKLSEKKREELFDVISEKAVSYGIGFATPAEIDEINILNASFLAMKRAIEAMNITPSLALIDGNRIQGLDVPAICIVKGDGKCASIAAASVLAKVSRDRFMRELDKEYPQYELAAHKGYPTKKHYILIKQYGILPFYRKSFLRNLADK